MNTSELRTFAQDARRSLMNQVSDKLTLVLVEGSAARRETPYAVKELEDRIKASTKDQVIEKVAYTWFNRFCALRFMDVNRYNLTGVVSPSEGQIQPEILADAKIGHIDEDVAPRNIREQVLHLLDGSAPSRDPQSEAYRLLVVAACNYYHKAMPYLFQRIDDYTELLMPEDLLSENSILAYTRNALTPDICEDVEVIGWLYQFYIAEKKDEVFDGLKKNQKITPENIPAATQLFTPHWIVRYLVENSLGRLWMLNRPNSRLIEQMDYYIKPEQPETDFLQISKPEDIKICDPACGSGHMLTYSFDLLYAIYEEEGYEPSEVPEKILTHNLFGIEIDERAGELAAFALTMKARAKQRRFFRRPVQPNICVLENIKFDEDELNEYMSFIGRDLFTIGLHSTLRQFEEAGNFGSLIRPEVTNVGEVLQILESKNVSGQLFLSLTHQKVLKALKQTNYLSPRYHVVIANPPYMGGKNMNSRLASWLKDNYPDVKSDLFSAFIVRNTELALHMGQLGYMSPFVWMFISTHEKLRSFLIDRKTITSLIQLEYSGFEGATVPICTFTLDNALHPNFRGGYVRLSDFRGADNQGPKTLEAIKNPDCSWFYRASANDYKKIPGSPIAYWASKKILNIFSTLSRLSKKIETREGLTTGSNDLFLRLWHEVTTKKIGFQMSGNNEAKDSRKRWYAYIKGGDYRRWSGNFEYIVNWYKYGAELKTFADKNTGRIRSHNYNGNYAFRAGFTWSGISSSYFAVRHVPKGFMFDTKGPMGFVFQPGDQEFCEAFLNSCVTSHLIKMLAPTLDFKLTHILNLPYCAKLPEVTSEIASKAIQVSQVDWDSFERSWDFSRLPLLKREHRLSTLESEYIDTRLDWSQMTEELKRLEEENNRIFIDAYGLRDELTPEVPLDEITLTCNPHYRYGRDKSEDDLEKLLLADTMKEFMSYAVGCMFGRYSLDKPGLILANQGETLEYYLRQVPEPSFPADKANVIPILDEGWFTDDVTERFREFLRVTFGDEHYEENLSFLEKAIGKDIRRYFLRDFYNDHVRRYKKRPIYWLFSSHKGSFNALIYMHRYRPDTVSVVLNDYLREFRGKLASRKNELESVSISASASQGEKTRALKEIDRLAKVIDELGDYESEVLFPLATQQIEIDLDDGVKVNYGKFGSALKRIPGIGTSDD